MTIAETNTGAFQTIAGSIPGLPFPTAGRPAPALPSTPGKTRPRHRAPSSLSTTLGTLSDTISEKLGVAQIWTAKAIAALITTVECLLLLARLAIKWIGLPGAAVYMVLTIWNRLPQSTHDLDFQATAILGALFSSAFLLVYCMQNFQSFKMQQDDSVSAQRSACRWFLDRCKHVSKRAQQLDQRMLNSLFDYEYQLTKPSSIRARSTRLREELGRLLTATGVGILCFGTVAIAAGQGLSWLS